ncbi:hypothetical protein DVH24_038909 [Malus domestica]|uniref:DUF7895 domain-containing protein n=1 Tax=Malus domestica TaxID=3750 RepID=A0A498KFU8_MALDO|nr:hypothetical protein DVH24_038909 [Malus domestica]
MHTTYFVNVKPREQRRRQSSLVSSALPETVASIAIAASVVGTAAAVLAKRTKAAEEAELSIQMNSFSEVQVPMKICEACRGSGICPECKGEGFVLKKLSDESAERARMASKNMATRYTAGLPKKWSYCTKCSSARSCLACSGRGKIALL